MYDHDIFAILTPKDDRNRAHTAFGLAHNSKWFHGATGGVAETPIINSRETTPAYHEDEESANPRLILHFDELLASDLTDGIRFGTNPKSCHVLLGYRGTANVSGLQYNIIVDDELRIWLHDKRSTYGTAVEYNGQCRDQIRKSETWILSYEPRNPNPFKQITIHAGSLSFQIEFPNHRKGDARYVQNLEEFVEKGKGLPAFQNLDVQSAPTTLAPSQAQTPGNQTIYFYGKVIGQGVFGQVTRVIRVRDGALFAAKTFHPPAEERKQSQSASSTSRKIKSMREEFDIMRHYTHHPNIVEVIGFHEDPIPQLILEYYPLGNWQNAYIHLEHECVTALGQLLDGLSHLHANGIAHRDLKPENILVARDPYLRFAISDFGLSKVFNDKILLRTFCGSPKYTAPEVFPGLADSYDASVDIWSLGVLILEAVYGLPEEPKIPKSSRWEEWIILWSQKLRYRLDDQDEDVLVTILDDMVKIKPEKRPDASSCLQRGFENGLFEKKVVDGLVVCRSSLNLEDTVQGAMTPKATSPLEACPFPQPEASTVISETLWDHEYIFEDTGGASKSDNVLSWPGKEMEKPLESLPGNGELAPTSSDTPPVLEEGLLGSHTNGRTAYPSTTADASHLSTRELFSESGFVYMVVRRQRISMRQSTHQLNASQILKAALREKSRRRCLMRKLRQRNVVDQDGNDEWVPFRDGVFLCQRVGLDREVEPLLLYPSVTLPKREANYLWPGRTSARDRELEKKTRDGYASLRCGEVVIVYRPAERTINATHILKAGGIKRAEVQRFFNKNPDIPKEFRPGKLTQGTYISYEHTPAFCAHFNLNLNPVQRLIGQAGGSIDRDEHFDIPSDPAIRIGQDNPGAVILESFNNPSGSELDDPGSVASHDYFTEPNFQNGSYLAPADRSHLQMLEVVPRSTVTPSTLPYDICSYGDVEIENGYGEWAEFFSGACDPACEDGRLGLATGNEQV